MQTQSRDQQGVASPCRGREPLQGDHKQKTQRHRCPGIEFCQLQSSVAEGTTFRVELFGGALSKWRVSYSYKRWDRWEVIDPSIVTLSLWIETEYEEIPNIWIRLKMKVGYLLRIHKRSLPWGDFYVRRYRLSNTLNLLLTGKTISIDPIFGISFCVNLNFGFLLKVNCF